LYVLDIHEDMNYIKGATVDSYCHRKGKPNDKKGGKYGALGSKCDSPHTLVKESFDFMKKEFENQIDFIIDTGDSIRHNRDKSLLRDDSEILSSHKRTVEYYKNAFDLNKMTVIPNLGNNDIFIHNEFNTNSSILKELAKIWLPYRLNLENNPTFLKGGYFKMDLSESIKVLSLNTLIWYKRNSILKDCNEDSIGYEQLIWLKQELNEAMNQNYKVYITGHVPPHKPNGKALYKKQCYKKYINLIGRYSLVINGYFHGHTNSDYISILVKYKNKDKKKFRYAKENNWNFKLITLTQDKPSFTLSPAEIVTVMTNGPSILPINNPAVRLYTYDRNRKGILIKYIQYYVNLTQSNLDQKLQFSIEYDTKLTYKMQDLSITSWKLFLIQLLKSKSNFYSIYSKFIKVSTK
ncbi:hypothetical protein K502DRAFT_288312, partial [Neoconidiobolus thromboides FSU 785]